MEPDQPGQHRADTAEMPTVELPPVPRPSTAPPSAADQLRPGSTDVEPDKVAIGDPLEMTFRRLFTADGIHNYFWKARPAR